MNEEQLKAQYLFWLESVKIRRTAYDSSKSYLKQKELDLKNAKRVFNTTYRDWKQARIEVEKSKRKWKSYPYKLRQWAKHNWGKVFNIIEKDMKYSQHFCKNEDIFKPICAECKEENAGVKG